MSLKSIGTKMKGLISRRTTEKRRDAKIHPEPEMDSSLIAKPDAPIGLTYNSNESVQGKLTRKQRKHLMKIKEMKKKTILELSKKELQELQTDPDIEKIVKEMVGKIVEMNSEMNSDNENIKKYLRKIDGINKKKTVGLFDIFANSSDSDSEAEALNQKTDKPTRSFFDQKSDESDESTGSFDKVSNIDDLKRKISIKNTELVALNELAPNLEEITDPENKKYMEWRKGQMKINGELRQLQTQLQNILELQQKGQQKMSSIKGRLKGGKSRKSNRKSRKSNRKTRRY